MQSLKSKHAASLVSRERLLTVLGMAKSVAVDPALASYISEFLSEMMQAIDVAAAKAADTCAGGAGTVGSTLVVKV